MTVVCFGYRSWALNIYKKLKEQFDLDFVIFDKKLFLKTDILKQLKPKAILLYGWSWFVPDEIVENYRCFMLHPSDLPNYRGGSPIQNQILDGLIKSKLTLFQMNNQMDGGPIYGKRDLNLTGEISDIFKRMENEGINLSVKLLEGKLEPTAQNHLEVSICKRRNPRESEITIEDLQNQTGEALYNKIRCLSDPYPNAYIKTIDGKRLLFKSALLKD